VPGGDRWAGAISGAGPVSTYRRPPLPVQAFRDASGAVIPYGRRWGTASAPEDTYSVVSHPERFAPVHDVADALVAHLVAEYDVDAAVVDARVAFPRQRDVVRTVVLRPRDPTGAPLTVGWTAFPGVVVRAGVHFSQGFPGCGCDACDESLEGTADELELVVIAVAEGRFSEEVTQGRIGHAITWADGRSSGSQSTSELPAAQVVPARATLAALPAGWQAWPRRRPPHRR
jgi:hypothetical protein